MLVAIAGHRSDAGDNTISGSGWTQHVYLNAHSGNSSYRHGLAIWSKIAGPAEPSTITTDVGAATSNLIIQEFSVASGSLVFDDSAQTVGDASLATTISTGTTAVSDTNYSLVISGLVSRDPIASTLEWTNGLTHELTTTGGATSNQTALYTAYGLHSPQSAKESTASWIIPRATSAGIVVFSTTLTSD